MLFIFTGFTSIGTCCSYFVIWTNILQGHNIAFYEPIKIFRMEANSPATLWLEVPNTCTLSPGFSVVKPANIPSQRALGGHFASWVLHCQTGQHPLPACTSGLPPQGTHLLCMGSALSRCHTFAYAVSLLEQSKPFLLSPPPVRSISSPSPVSHDAQRSSVVCTFYLVTIFLTAKPRGLYILS